MFDRVDESAIVEIKGQTWNRMVVLLKSMEERLASTSREQRNPRAVRVQNETGSNIAPHSIVKIGEPLTKPGVVTDDLGYQFQHSFKGESTDANTVDFGITIEGIPSDIGGGTKGIGIIRTHGICTASVNVTNAGHEYAKPSTTNGRLESTTETTGLKILFLSGTGVQKCKVMFTGGASGKPSLTIQAPATGIPSANNYTFGAVVCDVLQLDAGEWKDSGVTQLIHNPSTEVELTEGLRLGWAVWDGSAYVLVSKLCDDNRTFTTPKNLPLPGA